MYRDYPNLIFPRWICQTYKKSGKEHHNYLPDHFRRSLDSLRHQFSVPSPVRQKWKFSWDHDFRVNWCLGKIISKLEFVGPGAGRNWYKNSFQYMIVRDDDDDYFITFNSSLVPLIEGLCNSNPWEFEFSEFRRNRTYDLGINSPSLWPTDI